MKKDNLAFWKNSIYWIPEDLMQSVAEANLGRRLTKRELKRLGCAFFDNEEFYDHLTSGLLCIAEDVMDNTDGRWDKWDIENKKESLPALRARIQKP